MRVLLGNPTITHSAPPNRRFRFHFVFQPKPCALGLAAKPGLDPRAGRSAAVGRASGLAEAPQQTTTESSHSHSESRAHHRLTASPRSGEISTKVGVESALRNMVVKGVC